MLAGVAHESEGVGQPFELCKLQDLDPDLGDLIRITSCHSLHLQFVFKACIWILADYGLVPEFFHLLPGPLLLHQKGL